MGLNSNTCKLLFYLRDKGLNCGNTLTLGRQRLSLSKLELGAILSRYGHKESARALKEKNDGYCEPVLELLGATHVDSMDVSDYERATILHDLNQPIPPTLEGKYNLVIDSGTLEHVFNFPVAIKNCMQMLAVGGTYVGFTPANNFFGHGFYQFSPELYYRVFSKENGFLIEHMILLTDRSGTNFYSVSDPLVVADRVILENLYPTFLCVVARRIESKEIFSKTPQQSDYEHIVWQNLPAAKKMERLIPAPLRKPVRSFLNLIKGITRETGSSNSRYIKKLEDIW